MLFLFIVRILSGQGVAAVGFRLRVKKTTQNR
jgi:hypothetical protein